MNDSMWQVSGYTHVRELGAGASGQVVLATHDATGQPVAIKYLSERLGGDPSFQAAFRAEARLLAEIEDPHVARLYEYVESPRGAAIVMELVDGVSLRQVLRAHGPTAPESALYVLKGSLLGLAAAHSRGVVHRDYKPENVLVTPDGTSKLADFGIAVPIGQQTPEITGTPRYMAPEQWTGEPATPACDIYAATATFYECLTGRPPYDGDGDLTMLRRQHENAEIPTEPAPRPLHGLLRDGLAKQPAARPQPAAAFVELLDGVAVAAYGADWEETGRRKLAERAALLAALFPFAAAVGGGTAVATTALGVARGVRRKALMAGGTAALLLLGGVGLSYAAGDDTPTTVGTSGTPSATISASASPSATASPTPSPSPSTSVSPSPTASRSTYRPPTRTSGPPPPPPTSSPPPTDRMPPAIGSISADDRAIFAIDSAGYACNQSGPVRTWLRIAVSDPTDAPQQLSVTAQIYFGGTLYYNGPLSFDGKYFVKPIGPIDESFSSVYSNSISVTVQAVDQAKHRVESKNGGFLTFYDCKDVIIG